jgi:hypothetical protein
MKRIIMLTLFSALILNLSHVNAQYVFGFEEMIPNYGSVTIGNGTITFTSSYVTKKWNKTGHTERYKIIDKSIQEFEHAGKKLPEYHLKTYLAETDYGYTGGKLDFVITIKNGKNVVKYRDPEHIAGNTAGIFPITTGFTLNMPIYGSLPEPVAKPVEKVSSPVVRNSSQHVFSFEEKIPNYGSVSIGKGTISFTSSYVTIKWNKTGHTKRYKIIEKSVKEFEHGGVRLPEYYLKTYLAETDYGHTGGKQDFVITIKNGKNVVKYSDPEIRAGNTAGIYPITNGFTLPLPIYGSLPEPVAKPVEKVSSPVIWNSSQYNYSIEIPEGFTKTQPIGSNADFKAINGINSIVIVVKTIPQEYAVYSIWEVFGDLNTYGAEWEDGAKEYMNSPKFIKYGKTTLSSLETLWYDYTTENPKLYSKTYQTKKGNKLYTITLTCNDGDYNYYSSVWYRFKDKMKIY